MRINAQITHTAAGETIPVDQSASALPQCPPRRRRQSLRACRDSVRRATRSHRQSDRMTDRRPLRPRLRRPGATKPTRGRAMRQRPRLGLVRHPSQRRRGASAVVRCSQRSRARTLPALALTEQCKISTAAKAALPTAETEKVHAVATCVSLHFSQKHQKAPLPSRVFECNCAMTI